MALSIISTISILTMATSIAAVGQTNFTEACEVTRHEMIADNPSLGNETRLQCGQQYSPLIPPALPIRTDLSICLPKMAWMADLKSSLSDSMDWTLGRFPASCLGLRLKHPTSSKISHASR